MTRVRSSVLVAVALMVLGLGRPLFAQWPTVLMLYDGGLKQPVFVNGADSVPFGEIFRSAPKAGESIADMGDRPFIKVACFWGSADNPAINGTRMADLKPEMASQHGRFYPATKDKPAAMFVMGFTKSFGPGRGAPIPTDPRVFSAGGAVPASALAVLKRVGVSVGPSR